MSLLIRDAVEADLPALGELYLHLNPTDPLVPISQAAVEFSKLLGYEGSAILVGELDGRLVTSCTLIVIPNLTRGARPYALIENVVTNEANRGNGFATAILHAAIERAWRMDCYKVMLMTGSKKPATLRFYEKAGFEQSKTGFQIRNASSAG